MCNLRKPRKQDIKLTTSPFHQITDYQITTRVESER